MKNKSNWILAALIFSGLNLAIAQNLFRVDGNGLYYNSSSTNLDLLSTDDNTNSLMRFGDNNTIKVALGFNGNDDVFKISTATTLGVDDLTMDLSGLTGINTLPGNHRLLISHNSTAGINGSAHLALQENNTSDFARLRFSNLSESGFWTINARAHVGSFQTNFSYHDGVTETNLMSIDADNEFVGIHQTAPEAYLHIKQQFAGVDALAFVNDDATGGDKWSMRIGDEDILIYFNNSIRGGFDVSTGNYNNFPPAIAPLSSQSKMKDQVLDQVLQLRPMTIGNAKSNLQTTGFNPYEVEKINPDWVVHSEDRQKIGIDYLQLAVLAIKSIQEQQAVIEQQNRKIALLKARKAAARERLAEIEREFGKL